MFEHDVVDEVQPQAEQLEGRLACLHGYTLEQLLELMRDPSLAPPDVRAALPYVRASLREIVSRRVAHRRRA